MRTDGRTDGRTDIEMMMKQIVAFPNFASAPKNKEPKVCVLSSYFLTDLRKYTVGELGIYLMLQQAVHTG